MQKSRTLHINEIFESVQGEGVWTGEPMVFIRTSGCNRHCDWCDTLHQDGVEMTVEEIISKVNTQFKRVCITGGEPTIQFGFEELVDALIDKGFEVHVETNGTLLEILELLYVRYPQVWVTVSPKEELPEDTYQFVDEIKVVVVSQQDIDWALGVSEDLIDLPKFGILPISLQPVSTDKTATKLCYEACMEHPGTFRLSIQTHKLIGVQ